MDIMRPMPSADTAHDPALIDPPTESAPQPPFGEASPAGRNAAFLIAAEGAEEFEVQQPWEAVTLAGGRARLVCPQEGEAPLFDHRDRATRHAARFAEAVVVDESGPNVLVTSRKPQDLPEFCEALVQRFAGR